MSFNCGFCDKECKNKNSLAQHQIRCKLNPDKLVIESNFIEYNKKLKANLIIKINSNQFTKAEKLGLEAPIVSKETRLKLSKANKGRIWTDEQRDNHSKIMKETVLKNPESYSTSNVSGRVKNIKYKDYTLKGNWELLVAEKLDFENIKWTNIIDPIEYEFEDKPHLYFPDFYLIDYNLYIEVKGFERDKDLAKWNSLSNLIILKENEIKLLKKNLITIKQLITGL